MSKINQLYNDLSAAYSNDNLNAITGQLIELYKGKNFGAIRKIATKVSDFEPVLDEKDSKCFARLMKLYHPDRGEQYRRHLKHHFDRDNLDALEKHAHIFLVNDLEPYVLSASFDEIDYQPEYMWDDVEETFGFSDYDDDDGYEKHYTADDFERSFYNLIKLREYGHVDVELPVYYLEDIEQFELSYNGLETLDGVEYCTRVKILDVSNNDLTNIDRLWDLEELEELYLSNNQIGYIDALSKLTRLRVLDLSGNLIDDLSPILHLHQLEYINLIGNPVSDVQLKALQKEGRVVMV